MLELTISGVQYVSMHKTCTYKCLPKSLDIMLDKKILEELVCETIYKKK
jgi:hypothetical protein